MPIVTVEVVTGANDAIARDLAQSLADAVGRALKSPPGQTWIRLRSLPREQYAENESLLDAVDLPVFVTILTRKPPQGVDLESAVAALTQSIAEVIARPVPCVHVEYAPAALGRLSFGGTLVQ